MSMTIFFFNELDSYRISAEEATPKIVTEFCSDQPIIVAPVQSEASASCTFAYVGRETDSARGGKGRDTLQSG
jgi:hypothetical protein